MWNGKARHSIGSKAALDTRKTTQTHTETKKRNVVTKKRKREGERGQATDPARREQTGLKAIRSAPHTPPPHTPHTPPPPLQSDLLSCRCRFAPLQTSSWRHRPPSVLLHNTRASLDKLVCCRYRADIHTSLRVTRYGATVATVTASTPRAPPALSAHLQVSSSCAGFETAMTRRKHPLLQRVGRRVGLGRA